MDEYYIEKVEDYIKVVNENFPLYALSRGQTSDKPLLPSALRLDESKMRIYSDSKIKMFIEDFKNNSLQYIDGYGVGLKNDYEWMVYAQHFGVPTRLLDFTYSHMVSLMFAAEKAFNPNYSNSAVVWFLNYEKLNEYSLNDKEIVNLSNGDKLIKNMKYPCVVTARKINPRVIAQNGLFVLFDQNSVPLEKIVIAEEVLKKVVIPHDVIKRVLSELYAMGMRFNNMYPELTSVSKDILLKNNVLEFYTMEE